MRLYLVQHGQAKSEEVDPQRGLSERGIQDVGRLSGAPTSEPHFEGHKDYLCMPSLPDKLRCGC